MKTKSNLMLETERLRIIPLTPVQFSLFLNGINFIEDSFGLAASKEILDKHTQKAMNLQYQLAAEHPDDFLRLTSWQIILKSENRIIGSACFKNLPDADGNVEIGYGIYSAPYRNQGYMTEALKALCKWAFTLEGVKAVIAETEKNNVASQSVLMKNGMEVYKKSEEGIWWRLKKLE